MIRFDVFIKRMGLFIIRKFCYQSIENSLFIFTLQRQVVPRELACEISTSIEICSLEDYYTEENFYIQRGGVVFKSYPHVGHIHDFLCINFLCESTDL